MIKIFFNLSILLSVYLDGLSKILAPHVPFIVVMVIGHFDKSIINCVLLGLMFSLWSLGLFSLFNIFGTYELMKYSFILSWLPLYNVLMRKNDCEPYFYYIGRIIIRLLWDPPLMFTAGIN